MWHGTVLISNMSPSRSVHPLSYTSFTRGSLTSLYTLCAHNAAWILQTCASRFWRNVFYADVEIWECERNLRFLPQYPRDVEHLVSRWLDGLFAVSKNFIIPIPLGKHAWIYAVCLRNGGSSSFAYSKPLYIRSQPLDAKEIYSCPPLFDGCKGWLGREWPKEHSLLMELGCNHVCAVMHIRFSSLLACTISHSVVHCCRGFLT